MGYFKDAQRNVQPRASAKQIMTLACDLFEALDEFRLSPLVLLANAGGLFYLYLRILTYFWKFIPVDATQKNDLFISNLLY